MNNSPLKVGVVGGGVGRLHIESYQQLAGQVQLVALCDLDPARLKEVGDIYNIPLRYTDAYEMFNAGAVDAVSLCTPNNLHAPLSIAALEAGLHVLCEKPLAHTVAEGQRIIEAARRSSAKFMICYNRRYRPDIQWMRAMLDEQRLGQIYQVKAGWIRESGIPSGWFAEKEMSGGGSLIDLGVHMLDAVMWLLDFPQPLTVSGNVQANFGPRQAKSFKRRWGQGQLATYSVEDSATAFIRLAGGINLMFETSWASHARPGQDDIFITLMGTTGSIELYVANYANENTLTFYTEIGGSPIAIRPDVQGVGYDHHYAIAEFIRCIQEDVTPEASAEKGLVVMQIIEAIYRSAETSREVILAA